MIFFRYRILWFELARFRTSLEIEWGAQLVAVSRVESYVHCLLIVGRLCIRRIASIVSSWEEEQLGILKSNTPDQREVELIVQQSGVKHFPINKEVQ